MSVTLAEGVDSVVLPNPEFGDTDTIDFQAAIKHNRANEPLVVRDSDWPLFNTSRYEFLRLSESLKDDLISFLEDKAGLEITLTDHEAVVRTGVILNPDFQIITDGQLCQYSCAFEFLEDLS